MRFLKTTNYKLKTRSGFTLIEMVVVVAIFSLVLVAVSDVFVKSQRAQRRTSASAKLQDSTRFIFEKISSDIRNRSINYDYYIIPNTNSSQSSLSASGNDKLALINTDGTSVIYSSSSSDTDCGAGNVPCLMIGELKNICSNDITKKCSQDNDCGSNTCGVLTQERLTPEGVRITKDANDVPLLTFVISPLVDPFKTDQNGDYLSNTQPRVTIRLAADSRVQGVDEPSKIFLQTTVTTREYKR